MAGPLLRLIFFADLILFYMVECKDGQLFKLDGSYEGRQKQKGHVKAYPRMFFYMRSFAHAMAWIHTLPCLLFYFYRKNNDRYTEFEKSLLYREYCVIV